MTTRKDAAGAVLALAALAGCGTAPLDEEPREVTTTWHSDNDAPTRVEYAPEPITEGD